jgi:serine/threonine-protein kinase RsbW
MPPMRMTKPATVDNLALFLGFIAYVAERHGLAADVAQRLKLVVEEAVTNVVLHGYADREPDELTLSADLDGDTVVVTVEDRGHPFDPADAPVADVTSDLHERSVGGLGWHLIKELSERVDYAVGDPAADRPNRLTLRVGPSTRGGAA